MMRMILITMLGALTLPACNGGDADTGSAEDVDETSGSTGDTCYEGGWWDCDDDHGYDPGALTCLDAEADEYHTGYCDCRAYFGEDDPDCG